MKKYLFLLPLLALTGCDTTTKTPDQYEGAARDAAKWVVERQGFIEDSVAALTRVAVYSTEQNTFERTRTLEIMHAIAGNINALVANGSVNPDEIKEALRINEPYFGEVASALTSIIQMELKNFDNNGYQQFSVAVLTAVSKGIADGSEQ